MPFNFFKRSKKKKTINEPTIEAAEFTQEMFSEPAMKKRHQAALDFLKAFQNKMPLVNGKPHAGTALSIPARLAGTSLFRAINKQDHDRKTAVLSKEVNDAYPKLLSVFTFYCKEAGVDVTDKPTVTEIPKKDQPLMKLDQIQFEYQKQYHQIMQKHGLNYLESALVGMTVSSMIFSYHCIRNKDIDPYVANGIVTMGVIEGAKLSPVSLDAKSIDDPFTPARTKDSRFVVGEIEAVIKDVEKNGGQYTHINPAIAAELKEKNIDPKIIYVKGLESQLESRVGRVDFIEINIDEALQKTPNDQTPIPVFLAHWMNENAENYGYEREGSSWILNKV